MADVKLVSTDKWEALYINGINVLEGHILCPREMLETLAEKGIIKYCGYYIEEETASKINWNLPDKFEEIQKDMLEHE